MENMQTDVGVLGKEETGTDREDEREVTHFFKRNQGDKFREKRQR